MTHDQIEIVLGQLVEGCPSGQDAPQVFVGPFHPRFLVGCTRVTVIDPGTPLSFPVKFNRFGIGELGAVVGQKDGEEPTETIPSQDMVKTVEEVDDGLGGISLTQEQEQHGRLLEIQGQDDLAADGSNHRVHLDHRPGIFPHKGLEILIGSPLAALRIDLVLLLLLSRPVTDLVGQVEGRDISQGPILNEPVDGPVRTGQLVFVVDPDGVGRKTTLEICLDGLVDVLNLLGGIGSPGSGIRQKFPVFVLGDGGHVDVLGQPATVLLFAAIADKGCLLQERTGFLLKVRTKTGAAFLAG